MGFVTGVSLVILIFIIFNSCSTCKGNYCCPCGVCNPSSIFDSCNDCQCLGEHSEGCHMSGWDKSSPCCNESSTMEECREYLEDT
jgi:hypothetical protein